MSDCDDNDGYYAIYKEMFPYEYVLLKYNNHDVASIIVGVLTFPTIIIPILMYYNIKREERNKELELEYYKELEEEEKQNPQLKIERMNRTAELIVKHARGITTRHINDLVARLPDDERQMLKECFDKKIIITHKTRRNKNVIKKVEVITEITEKMFNPFLEENLKDVTQNLNKK